MGRYTDTRFSGARSLDIIDVAAGPWIMPKVQAKTPLKGTKNPNRYCESPEIIAEKSEYTV